jgi:hypothetical protein
MEETYNAEEQIFVPTFEAMASQTDVFLLSIKFSFSKKNT